MRGGVHSESAPTKRFEATAASMRRSQRIRKMDRNEAKQVDKFEDETAEQDGDGRTWGMEGIEVTEDDDLYRDAVSSPPSDSSESYEAEELTERPAKRPKWTLDRVRELAGWLVNNKYTHNMIVILIIVNSALMGVGTFEHVRNNPSLEQKYENWDRVFLVIFTIEIGLQLLYHGPSLFNDGWLVFDFVVVFVSWTFGSLQIVRAFRIFRTLRLITRVDTLRRLVAALLSVLPRLTAIAGLLALTFYIFGVMFTTLFKHMDLEEDYFSRLDKTWFTLFQMLTMDFAEVSREVMAEIPWAWAPFVAFISITGFIVFNLIIAVICDAVAIIEHENDDEMSSVEGVVYVREGGFYGVGESRTRINELTEQVGELLRHQREMQALVESLAQEIKGVQSDERPELPDADRADGTHGNVRRRPSWAGTDVH